MFEMRVEAWGRLVLARVYKCMHVDVCMCMYVYVRVLLYVVDPLAFSSHHSLPYPPRIYFLIFLLCGFFEMCVEAWGRMVLARVYKWKYADVLAGLVLGR